MPAISLDTLQKVLPPEQANSIYDGVFGPKLSPMEQAANQREAAWQDYLNARKTAVEKERTDAKVMSGYNALGNLLTTMVQPIGWRVGGGKGITAGVQPYDSRQYLDAFNRAAKATEDLRNLGTLEDEYRFKLADENYRRERAIQDYQDKARVEVEKQRQILDFRKELNQEQIAGRIAVAEATARAKYNFSTNGGKKVTESVRDNLLKRANTAYATILADYYKKKAVGIENLQEPPTYEDFLKQFASTDGISVTEGGNATKPTTATGGNNTSTSSRKPNPMGGGSTNSPASGKKKNPMNS